MSEIKIVKIDPEKWDRGRGDPARVKLLGKHGMCCMGFAALAFGADEGQIKNCPTWRVCRNETLAARDRQAAFDNAGLYHANDDLGHEDAARVARLNQILEAMDENFRFELGAE